MSKDANEEKQPGEEKPAAITKISLRDLVPFVIALLQTSLLPFILLIMVFALIGMLTVYMLAR